MCKKKEIRVLDLTAREYAFMARGYFDSGLFDKALECVENACYLYPEVEGYLLDEEYARCLQIRAYILGQTGEKKQFVKAFRKAKKIRKKQNDAVGYADCLIDEGTAFCDLGKFNKAVRLRKKALKRLSVLPDAVDKRNKALYFLGASYYKKRKDGKAERCFIDAVKGGEGDERLFFALSCTEVRLKKYEDALKYLFIAQKKCEDENIDTPYDEHLGEIYLLIGDVYTLMELPIKAVKFYARALKVCEGNDRVKKDPAYKNTLLKLYSTYDKLGESDHAQAMLRLWEQA